MSLSSRDLFELYSAAVVYVSVRLPNGYESIGSAFHVGEGVFLTAKHVVDGNEILEVANTIHQTIPDEQGNTTIHGKEGKFRSISPSKGNVVKGPFFHPDDSVDVAAIVVEGIDCPVIPLGGHLDDWINDDDFILREVIVLGYPPVPLSDKPVLVTSRAEINAVVDKYIGRHPHFIISSMARGGFSGGPCLIEWDFSLGLITESLGDGGAAELGYMSVISVEPLYVCLSHHGILPKIQSDGWDGLWDKSEKKIDDVVHLQPEDELIF
jgi:V8-like Glu-specific endopeptidase